MFSRRRMSRLTFQKVFCLQTKLSDLKLIGVFTSKIITFHFGNLRRARANKSISIIWRETEKMVACTHLLVCTGFGLFPWIVVKLWFVTYYYQLFRFLHWVACDQGKQKGLKGVRRKRWKLFNRKFHLKNFLYQFPFPVSWFIALKSFRKWNKRCPHRWNEKKTAPQPLPGDKT